MKKTMFFKSVVTLLLFICMLSFVSCSKKDEAPDYDENRRLEIVEEITSFDEEYIENANAKFTKIATSLIKSYTDYTIDNDDLSNVFNSKVIPILYRVNIYPEELDEIFTALEDFTDSMNSSDKPMFLSVYEICLYVLGAERSGHLAYEISLSALEHKINTYTDRLESTGISFYKNWISRCTALHSDLESMGKTKFSNALSMSTAIFSTLFSIDKELNENAFTLSDTEFLFILDMQSDNLKEKNLSEDEWQTFGGLISEFIPNKQASLNQKVIYSLKNYTHSGIYDENTPSSLYKSSYFSVAMRAMPKIVELFADLSNQLKIDGAFSLNGSKEEKEQALIHALAECEESLLALDSSLKAYASFDPDYLQTAVATSTNADELKSFINGHSAKTCDDLISELRAVKDGGELSDAKFDELLVSYVYSYSPYLAYVIYLNSK